MNVWGFGTPRRIPSYCDLLPLCSRAPNSTLSGTSSFPHYFCKALVWSIWWSLRLFWCHHLCKYYVVKHLLTNCSTTKLLWSALLIFYFPPSMVGLCLHRRWPSLPYCWDHQRSWHDGGFMLRCLTTLFIPQGTPPILFRGICLFLDMWCWIMS